MKKETMLTELETELEKQLVDIDFAIDWDTKNHRVEIILAIFAENKEGETIEDEDGVLTEENYIEFEDAILFYANDKTGINEDDFLTTIPFDRKKGLSKEYINVFASYLNEVALEGQDDLLDFLSDETIEFFELKWDDNEFIKRVSEIEEKTAMPYPKY